MAGTRGETLEAARGLLALSVPDLWFDYVGLGGNLPPVALEAILAGRAEVSDRDHDLLAQALNERFADRASDHPVAYADEIPLKSV